MGQYYNILTLKDGKYTNYNRKYYNSKGEPEYMMAKLTEHSWIGNATMECFSNIILRNPTKVAWVGDYVDQYEEDATINNLTREEIVKLGELAWQDNETVMEFRPLNTRYMLLVNWTKKEYISMFDYIENSTIKYGTFQGWCLHPLSLLTAIGNGFGGGDYHGINEDLVGSWAFDEISFESEDIAEELKNQQFVKTNYEFKENY